MKRFLVLAALASLGAGAVHAQPRALTLAEAVEMARRNAVAVVRAEGSSQNAAQGVRSAMGAFLPSLSFSTGSTRQLGRTGSTRIENGQVVTVAEDPWSSSLGLSAAVDLFDGGRRFFDLRQARASRVSAEVDEDAARWQAALAAKQAFFDVLAARETQVAAAAQLEQADRQRWAAIARTRAKAATSCAAPSSRCSRPQRRALRRTRRSPAPSARSSRSPPPPKATPSRTSRSTNRHSLRGSRMLRRCTVRAPTSRHRARRSAARGPPTCRR